MRRLLFIIAAAIMVVAMSVRTRRGIDPSRIDDPDLRAVADSMYAHRYDPPGNQWDGTWADLVEMFSGFTETSDFRPVLHRAYREFTDSARHINRNLFRLTSLEATNMTRLIGDLHDPDSIALCINIRSELYGRLLSYGRKLYGDTSYRVAETMAETAFTYLESGQSADFKKGTEQLRDALAMMSSPAVMSASLPQVCKYLTENYMRIDYRGLHRLYADYVTPVAECVAARTDEYPALYIPLKVELYDNIAKSYRQAKDIGKAFEIYTFLLTDTAAYDADDRLAIKAMFLPELGDCYSETGELRKALDCYLRAEAASAAVDPDNWKRTLNLHNIASLMKAMGDTAGARDIVKKRIDLMADRYRRMPDSLPSLIPSRAPTDDKAEAALTLAHEYFMLGDDNSQKAMLDEACRLAGSHLLKRSAASQMAGYYIYRQRSTQAMEWIDILLKMAEADHTGLETFKAKQLLASYYERVTIDPDLGLETILNGLDDYSRKILKQKDITLATELTTDKSTIYSQWSHIAVQLGNTGNHDGSVSALERCLHYMREFGDTVGDSYHYARLQLIDTRMRRHFPWGDRPDSVQARLWCDRYRDYFLEHRREFADMPYLNPAGVGNNYYYAVHDSATASYWFDRQEEELRRDNPGGYRASEAYLDLLENRARITTDQASRRQRYQTMLAAARAAGNSLKTKAALSGIITEFQPDPQTYRSALKEMIALADTTPSAGPYERAYLVSLAQSYYDCGMTDSLTGIYAEANDAAHKYLMHRFREAPADRRESMWQIYSQVPFGIGEELHETAPAAVPAAMVYDNILFRKGLLLNSSVAVENLIRTQGDSLLMAKFDRMTRLRNALKAGRDSVTDRDRTFPRKQAEALASRFESEAMERAAMLDDYTAALRCDHSQVQGALRAGDAAVEFTHYTRRDGSQAYAALVLKPEGAPRFVPLCPADSLADTGFDRYADLSARIWGPLTADLKGVRNIYFSPDGILHTLPLECLPDPAQPAQTIGDTHACRRLSSTRTLVSGGRRATPSAISLYGGLRYDSPTDSLIADARRYPVIATTRSAIVIPDDTTGTDRAAADSTLLRSTMAYLPATKTEAENIARECHARDIDTRLLMAHNGTEASLKALSGRQLDILHLATHGFYWTERQAARLRRLGFLNTNSARTDEDNALARSGLLMAGANNALRGIALPAEVDDGIATAEEISRLDLRGLDMVVLSACQSGLGEVTGEGVFGLQRGFKKAGARSLLVSLWPVDDRATQMLMESFYRHYLSGRSKADALALARAELRAYTTPAGTSEPADTTALYDLSDQDLTPAQRRRLQKQTDAAATGSAAPDLPVHPYDAPRYWAAFVLVDALD